MFSTHQDNQLAINFQVCEGELPVTKDNHVLVKV